VTNGRHIAALVNRGKGTAVDWDKLRIFQAAAEAGSFTHAGESVGLSQSAVSRQVSALEADLEVPLFHRHARGLILTEQGELLFRTVKDVMLKLDAVKTHLTDSREKPNGELRITTTYGMGTNWLAPRLGEFHELYPDIKLTIILSDEELDLSMREADLALRLRQPTQPDLIQRRLFTVHFHTYAAPEYLKKNGYLANINALSRLGRDSKSPRVPALTVNNITALHKAVVKGVGIAILPDYIIDQSNELVRLLPEADMPELECYLVYPEEVKSVARVQVFRDFLVAKAQRWQF
jgi:DNA-binding transcriptional LysR family regulator